MAPTPVPGNAAAFAAMFAAQAPRLYRMALGFLGNPHDAADALQEAGLKGLRFWDGLLHPEAGPAWLTRIVLNCCHDLARRRAAAAPAGLLTGEPQGGAPPEVPDPDLQAALGALPPEQREVVVLRFYQDWTVPQIARVMAVPEGTVKSRLHTAMGRMRSWLATHSREREDAR